MRGLSISQDFGLNTQRHDVTFWSGKFAVSYTDNVHSINVNDFTKVLWICVFEPIAKNLIYIVFLLLEALIEMDRVHYETYESENYYDSMGRDSTVRKVTSSCSFCSEHNDLWM